MEGAARAVDAWLKNKEDACRLYLQILSGGGIVYAAQCEEKLMRAYLALGSSDEDT